MLKIEAYQKEEKPIVYIDESGFTHESIRTHGYSMIGKRCYGISNWSNKRRTNVIGAMKDNQLITSSLFNHNIDGDIFYAWVIEDLLPKLKGNEVITMDNVSFHKRKDIIKAIEDKGCKLLFLPTYSPDLNPIEHKWHEFKSIRRKNNWRLS
jgi:hypothetical protein